jgi:hypothetical protein
VSRPPIPLVPVDILYLDHPVVQTAIGTVAATTQARVFIESDAGAHLLSCEEAHQLWVALMKATYAAEQWGNELAGQNRIRVRIREGGVVEATWHGETKPLRLSHATKHARTCHACKEKQMAFWCDQRGPGYFVVLCDPCVNRLAAEPDGPRDAAP